MTLTVPYRHLLSGIACLVITLAANPAAQSAAPSPGAEAQLTMGQLVHLTSTNKLTFGLLHDALASGDAGVRAVAARIIGVKGLVATRDALIAAFNAETDAHVRSEQTMALLMFGRPETIAAVESAFDRQRTDPLQFAHWLSRSNPDGLIQRLPLLTERLGDRAGGLGEVVVRAAAQHPAKREALFRSVQQLVPANAWPDVVGAMIAGDPSAADLIILREALDSTNEKLREHTVWEVVGRTALQPRIAASVLEVVLASTPVTGDLTWERFGREIVARYARKTRGEDRSDLIGRVVDRRRAEAYGLESHPALRDSEREALRNALGRDGNPGSRRDSGSVVTPGQRAGGLRLFPTVWPGFIESLFKAAGCVVSKDPRIGGAEFTFGPDGRPVSLAVDTTGLSSGCATALLSLQNVAMADPSELPTTTPQWHVLPITSDFVTCSNAPHRSEPVADGPSDAAEAIEAPKKTRDVAPVYPGNARAKGVQGVVVIEAIISSTGCISSAKVIRSVSASLDLAAMNAVSGWRYSIPLRGDTPVDVLMTVSVNFTLH